MLAGPPPRADLPLPARRRAHADDGALRETSSSTCPDVWEPIDVAPVERVTPHPGQGTGPPRLDRHPRVTTVATATPGGGCPPAGASYHGSRAGVAQSAEHSPCKRKVRGSIPRAGSTSDRDNVPRRGPVPGPTAPTTAPTVVVVTGRHPFDGVERLAHGVEVGVGVDRHGHVDVRVPSDRLHDVRGAEVEQQAHDRVPGSSRQPRVGPWSARSRLGSMAAHGSWLGRRSSPGRTAPESRRGARRSRTARPEDRSSCPPSTARRVLVLPRTATPRAQLRGHVPPPRTLRPSDGRRAQRRGGWSLAARYRAPSIGWKPVWTSQARTRGRATTPRRRVARDPRAELRASSSARGATFTVCRTDRQAAQGAREQGRRRWCDQSRAELHRPRPWLLKHQRGAARISR